MIVEVHPQQAFGEVEPVTNNTVDVITGESIIHFEDRALQTATIHRPDDDLVIQRPEKSKVINDVGGAQYPIHTGARQSDDQPVQEIIAVPHRQLPATYTECSPGRMIGGDDKQPAIDEQSTPLTGRVCRLDPARLERSNTPQLLEELQGHTGWRRLDFSPRHARPPSAGRKPLRSSAWRSSTRAGTPQSPRPHSRTPSLVPAASPAGAHSTRHPRTRLPPRVR